MPSVTCFACGAETHVRFRRGVRLAEISCPICGQAALHRPHKGARNRNAGKTYERCAHCDKRGLHLLHPAFEWRPKYQTSANSYPAGSPACWFHEPVPAPGRASYPDVENAAIERLGERQRWANDEERAQLQSDAAPLIDCPVCAPFGDGWNRGFYDHALRFAAGLALLSSCESCGHTIQRAAVHEALKQTVEIPR